MPMHIPIPAVLALPSQVFYPVSSDQTTQTERQEARAATQQERQRLAAGSAGSGLATRELDNIFPDQRSFTLTRCSWTTRTKKLMWLLVGVVVFFLNTLLQPLFCSSNFFFRAKTVFHIFLKKYFVSYFFQKGMSNVIGQNNWGHLFSSKFD